VGFASVLIQISTRLSFCWTIPLTSTAFLQIFVFHTIFFKAGETQSQDSMKEEPMSQSLLGKTQINYVQFVGKLHNNEEIPSAFIFFINANILI
jgi:hypothetical protein